MKEKAGKEAEAVEEGAETVEEAAAEEAGRRSRINARQGQAACEETEGN